jgi:16S rRNA (cytosine967-C5)-methyltransferase
MPVSPARSAAFDILLRVAKHDSYAAELLHSQRCAELSSSDKGLTTELVMGVLRWQSALDSVIAKWSSQKIARIDAEVLIALRLGAYQLVWLDRIPVHAAIHESVELVKSARKRSAAPFANAVLRRLSEVRDKINPASIESAHDAATLASLSAHPQWMVERWISRFGFENTRKVCQHNQSIPATTIRLRDRAAEDRLQSEGVTLGNGLWLTNARRVLAGDVTVTSSYRENLVAIQDEASQLVAALVGTGKQILDCCAAPGGKSWAMADRNPRSQILAVEVHGHRASLLKKRVAAPNVHVINADACQLPISAQFDRVLVDAPCSGTGTLARNPEIKWRLMPEDVADLHTRQAALVRSAMNHVSVSGRLIFATCSLEHEEGEHIVDGALRTNSAFRVVGIASVLEELLERGELKNEGFQPLIHGDFLRTIPGTHDCDGFFAAVLERVR